MQIKLIGCVPKPDLKTRGLITHEQANELMALFKILANNTRLRLIHALIRSDEMCVIDMAAAVEMKPQAVSNQLQRLVDKNILKATRKGNNIYYRVVDSCVPDLIHLGLCLNEETVIPNKGSK